jgi:hypothetical protein
MRENGNSGTSETHKMFRTVGQLLTYEGIFFVELVLVKNSDYVVSYLSLLTNGGNKVSAVSTN